MSVEEMKQFHKDVVGAYNGRRKSLALPKKVRPPSMKFC
jgi:hypothetical protein